MYNYVFIFFDNLYKFLFNDLTSSTDAQFIQHPLDPEKCINNPVLSAFYRIHFSYKLNHILPIPFKQFWNKRVFNFELDSRFDKTVPFCFIISARNYESYGDLLITHLRCTFKDCKIICWFTDLVKNHSETILGKLQIFDAIFSFEKSDAEKYGFIQMDLPYSRLDIQPVLPKSDVFFVGNAKNRLKTILSVYERLAASGLRCDFYIKDTDDDSQPYADHIVYNKPLEYDEIVQHINATQCILEVIQKHGNSPTIRPLEAVCYNKKFLTNCTELVHKDYYNDEYMSIFSDPANIDIDFIKKPMSIDYHYAEKLSPLELIKKINKNIEKISPC